ncbi:flavin reductase family protein [uncultured Sphingomonas sp.]|uniref:flavin reductase family protein n=1 Tax=uncultured Sphingomonas sp. TaxID=158754 RepID=UPI0035CC5B2B
MRPFDAAAFRRVLGHYPTGVCVVTAMTDDGPTGMVVGSFTSASLEPPLVAFLPDRRSTTWSRIEGVGRFCVNILASEQHAVCDALAKRGGDKFRGISHRLSANGSPILDSVVAWIDCEVQAVHDAGDHLFVLGRVIDLEVEQPQSPLIFFQGGYGGFLGIVREATAPVR